MSTPPTRRPRRRARRLLGGALVVVLSLAGLSAGLLAFAWTTAAVDAADDVEFKNRLPVPPLADRAVDDDGRCVFDRVMLSPGERAEVVERGDDGQSGDPLDNHGDDR